MENKIFSKTEELSAVDAGLRQYMIKVYNFMAAGLCLTALTAYLIANTSLLGLFFNLNPAGQVTGMSGFGWLMFIAPLIMVFAFGWVVTRGTANQVQTLQSNTKTVFVPGCHPRYGQSGTNTVLVLLCSHGSISDPDFSGIYGYQCCPRFPDHSRNVRRHEHLWLYHQT